MITKEEIESFGFKQDIKHEKVLQKNNIKKSYKIERTKLFRGCCIDVKDYDRFMIFMGPINSYRGLLRFHGELRTKEDLDKVLDLIGFYNRLGIPKDVEYRG
jgi:hypothetical protein